MSMLFKNNWDKSEVQMSLPGLQTYKTVKVAFRNIELYMAHLHTKWQQNYEECIRLTFVRHKGKSEDFHFIFNPHTFKNNALLECMV